MIVRYVCLFVSTLVLGGLCSAETYTVQGEIAGEAGRDTGSFTIELQPANGGLNPAERAFVSTDGRFEFRNVESGTYLVVVKDMHGAVIYRDYTTAQSLGRVSIRLPEAR